jgi:hypothetical protein
MKSPAMKNIDTKNHGRLTTGLVAAWFAFALIASDLLWFRNDGNRIGIAVGVAAGMPILVFAAWFTASEKFRKFALSLDPQILTLAQTWRIIGFIFVDLEARGILPAIFAWPAGYGDMIIGATATFAAWKLASPVRRNRFILWQVLGITDLVTAVGLGTTAGLISPHGPSMAPMTVLPLSVIPTFLVPLFFILHLICIAQARAWKVASGNTVTGVKAAQYSAI